jgi:hypothetical protein
MFLQVLGGCRANIVRLCRSDQIVVSASRGLFLLRLSRFMLLTRPAIISYPSITLQSKLSGHAFPSFRCQLSHSVFGSPRSQVALQFFSASHLSRSAVDVEPELQVS